MNRISFQLWHYNYYPREPILRSIRITHVGNALRILIQDNTVKVVYNLHVCLTFTNVARIDHSGF